MNADEKMHEAAAGGDMIPKAIVAMWVTIVLVLMIGRPSLTPPGRPDRIDAIVVTLAPLFTSLYAIKGRSWITVWAMLIVAFFGLWVAWESNTRLALSMASGVWPHVVWWMSVCGWIFILGRMGPGIVWAIRNRIAKGQDGRCPSCGYDLRASPERCPECGTEVAKTKTGHE